ncbi:hypothetical protein GGH92_005558 [Coemansia sp. RSA 2673]|nr:hypothetical protein GGH92_005558 [Coemansia sp. RSA 2673]
MPASVPGSDQPLLLNSTAKGASARATLPAFVAAGASSGASIDALAADGCDASQGGALGREGV